MENTNAPVPENGTTETQNNEQAAENTPQTTSDNKNTDELAKKEAEIARLGKLVNQYAEKERLAKEEDAKKNGEFQKLFEDKKAELETLTSEHDNTKEINSRYEEFFKAEFEKSLQKIPKEKQETISLLLDGKTDFEKFSLLPKILSEFFPSQNGFGGVPSGQTAKPNEKSVEDLIKA